MSHAAVGAPGTPRRYLHSLWLLSARDLKVRYATSFLGYLWSVLDPLVMSLIYLLVFTFFFKKDVGADPYIVFLIAGLLPWVWFNTSVSDFTRAFRKDAKLAPLYHHDKVAAERSETASLEKEKEERVEHAPVA